MTNHITNILTIKGSEQRVKEVLDFIKEDENLIDFDKILPMPPSLRVTSGSNVDNAICILINNTQRFTEMLEWSWIKEQGITDVEGVKQLLNERLSPQDFEEAKISLDNIEKYGHANWYGWSIANWGTKWNSYDNYQISENSISFDTAWSTPFPVIHKLAELYPDLLFEVKFADEDIGNNCGIYVFDNGNLVKEYLPNGYEATKFALSIKSDGDMSEHLGWSLPYYSNEEWDNELEEDVADIITDETRRDTFLESIFENCEDEEKFYSVKGKLVNLCVKYELYEYIKPITEKIKY
jgi:hypothetical protein